MKKFFLSLSILLVLTAVSMASAVKVTGVKIGPLNRAVIYCSDTPSDSSYLSSDKKKISVVIKNAEPLKQEILVNGKGIIKEVRVYDNNSRTVADIILKDKRGYTVMLLPYSKAIMAETFDWNNLDKGEDYYRQGLLSLESGILSSSKILFTNASLDGNADAMYALGMLLLNEGKINKAVDQLLAAVKSGTNIDDVYGGLSHAYKLLQNDAEAEQYRKKFIEKSGLQELQYFDISGTPIDIDSNDILPSIISELRLNRNDTINHKNDSIPDTTAVAGLNEARSIDSANTAESTEGIFDSMSEYMLYLAVAALLLFLLLLTQYFKWRRRQLDLHRNMQQRKFKMNLKNEEERVSGKAHAANMYKKQEESVQTTHAAKQEPKTKTEPPIKSKPEPKVSEKPKTLEENIERIARELEKSQSKKKPLNPVLTEEDEKELEAKQNKPRDPKLELAMRLQEEQKKLKDKSGEESNSFDKEKMEKIARNLGMEKSEKKKPTAKSKISTDKEALSKLSEKFSVKRNKDND